MMYAMLFLVVLALAAIYGWVFTVNRSLKVRFWGVFSIVTLALLFVVFLFNASFEKFRQQRVDITRGEIYTISQYTEKILRSLQAPVTVTYYVSPQDKLPTAMKTLERDVRDKLEEMKIAGGGRFHYRLVHPDPGSSVAEKLQRKGIRARRVQSIDSDEFSLRNAYSSLEIQYLQQDPEIVEFISPMDLGNLEYELASRIYKLSFGADTTDYTDDTLFTTQSAVSGIYPRLQGQVVLYYVENIGENTAHLPENMKGVKESVLNKLRGISAASGGKVVLQEPQPQLTQQLLFVLARKGLMDGVPLASETPAISLGGKEEPTGEEAKKDEKKVFSCVYLNLFQKEEDTVPLVTKDNLDQLEQEIHRRIARRLNRKRPKVAVYAPREELSQEQKMLAQQLGRRMDSQEKFNVTTELLQRENYEVVKTDITAKSPIPSDAQTLILLDPTPLSDRQRYEVEKFIHRGRNLIVAAQRYEFNFSPDPAGGFAVVPNRREVKLLDETFNAFGVSLDPDILMDKNMETLNITVSKPANFGGFRVMAQSNELVKTPIQVKIGGNSFPSGTSLGNRVERLLYFGGSRLKLDEGKLTQSGVEVTPILNASAESWTRPYVGGRLSLDPPAEAKMFLDKPLLGVLLKGKFSGFWKDKPVPLFTKEEDPDGNGPQPPQAKPDESTREENQIVGDPRESRILVLGCSDLFKDDFMGDVNHQVFFLNCVDALALGEDLIHIRAKAAMDPPIRATSDNEKAFWKFFVIGLIPLLFAVVGTLVIGTAQIRANS